jgi:hypothetical protein
LLDLSQAFSGVFMVAVILVASTYIPAVFLPRKPAAPEPGQAQMLAQ